MAREQFTRSPDINNGTSNGHSRPDSDSWSHTTIVDFYTEEGPRLRNFVRGMVFGDLADAEDLAATTMEKAFRHIQRGTGGKGGFKAWVYRIGINTARNHIRDSQRHPTTYITRDHELFTADDSFSNPVHHVERQENIAEVRAAFAQLQPQWRQALTLAYVENKSHEDIAREMGRTVGAIKSLIFRAKEQLRQLLARQMSVT